jgi:uncharacterized membrane protein
MRATASRLLTLLVACAAIACSQPSTPADPPSLPCDVDAVLRGVCQQCHMPSPENGAPFPLVTYADTRAPFSAPPTYQDAPIWKVMGDVVEADAMPPDRSGVTITRDQRDVILAWVDAGAPPADAGTMCP